MTSEQQTRPPTDKEAAIQAWLRLYAGNDIDVAADIGKFYDYFIEPALREQTRITVERIHDAECQFAGGGMCYRLECSTLDRLRAAALPRTPGEEGYGE